MANHKGAQKGESKSNLARKYRDKYGMGMPTLKLARIMYKENNLSFTNIEHARAVLRQIEGKAKTSNVAVTHPAPERPRNPYNLPASDEKEYLPYNITGYKKIAGFFDIHCPYHSLESLTCAIKYCKKEKVDLLLLGGDFWDFYGLSRFLKDPKKRKIGHEINTGVEILNILQKELKCKIIYLFGNHCQRLQHFLWQKWGELDQLTDLQELQEITLENIVRRRSPNLDIEFVGDKRIIKANDLNIVHGHEFASSIMSPVNIARGLYLRAKANTICGHHHRSSEHTEMNINGKIVTTWSIGCLAELHPEYMPINSWNHGFCIIELDNDKESFRVHNKRIYKGEVL
jgi:hypothetical protein